MKHLKLFENFDENDPFGEEFPIIPEPVDENIVGYFVVHRDDNYLNKIYIKSFLIKYRPKIHTTLESARMEYRRMDIRMETSSCVVALYKDGNIKWVDKHNNLIEFVR